MDNDNTSIFIGEGLTKEEIQDQWFHIVDLLSQNGGEGSNINADMIDGFHADHFLTKESLQNESLVPGLYIGNTQILNKMKPGQQYLTAKDSNHSSIAGLIANVVKPGQITPEYQEHSLDFSSTELEDIVNKIVKYVSYNIEWLKKKEDYNVYTSKFYNGEHIEAEIEEIKNELSELKTTVERLDNTLSQSIENSE